MDVEDRERVCIWMDERMDRVCVYGWMRGWMRGEGGCSVFISSERGSFCVGLLDGLALGGVAVG